MHEDITQKAWVECSPTSFLYLRFNHQWSISSSFAYVAQSFIKRSTCRTCKEENKYVYRWRIPLKDWVTLFFIFFEASSKATWMWYFLGLPDAQFCDEKLRIVKHKNQEDFSKAHIVCVPSIILYRPDCLKSLHIKSPFGINRWSTSLQCSINVFVKLFPVKSELKVELVVIISKTVRKSSLFFTLVSAFKTLINIVL